MIEAVETPYGLCVRDGESPYGSHRHALIRQCARRAYMTYEAEGARERKASRAPLLGSLIHAGIAQILAAECEPQRAWATSDDGIKHADPDYRVQLDAGFSDPYAMHQHAKNAVEAFRVVRHDLWCDMATIGVEEVIQETFRYGEHEAYYTQAVDWVAQDHNGQVWFIDHKKTSKLHSDTERYAIDSQFIGYQVLGRKLYGDRFAGCAFSWLVEKSDKKSEYGKRWEAGRAVVPFAPAMAACYERDVVRATFAYNRRVDNARAQLPVDGDSDEFVASQLPGAYSQDICYGRYASSKCPVLEQCKYKYK